MKIGLCGSHGTGKTTLLNEFYKIHPNFKTITEIARLCPFPINENTSYIAQQWILKQQIKIELDNYPCNQISDRTTIDQIAYIINAYFREKIKSNQSNELIRIARAWNTTYDRIFYVPIEFPLVDDGFRSTDIKFQKDVDYLIKKEILNDKRVITLNGSVENRIKIMEETLNDWML